MAPSNKNSSIVCSVLMIISFHQLLISADALNRDLVTDVSRNPIRHQQADKQQAKELLNFEVLPGPQPRSKRMNEGSLPRELALSVQSMREQIESAKKLASFARLHKHPRLLRELQLQIRESERAVGNSVADADLPKSAPEKMKALKRVMARAMERHDKCEDMVKRLRLSVLANEDRVSALTEESRFLGKLAARTMPKGLHCLALQLTILYYNQYKETSVFPDEFKLEDSSLWHYVLYTENILAATAIVSSTAFFAKEPHRHVFHVLTDGLNYAALKMWFQTNKPDKVVVEVLNLDNTSFLHVLGGLQQQAGKHSKPGRLKDHLEQEENSERIKKLGLYYYLPEIFPTLDKVMVLDNDIIVQKDLTYLWEEDLHNRVIGALKFCSNDDGWSCINMVDLGEWRRQGFTEMYKYSILSRYDEGGLISLQNNTHMLDDPAYHVLDLNDSWMESGNVASSTVAIHYRGYAKPWLGMGGSNRHRSLWTRFVNYENPLLQACNINK